MCRYRKTLFQCNHSALSQTPLIPCPAYDESSPSPCAAASTHACATVRVAQLCDRCADRKQGTDRRLSEVKVRIAGLRDRLSEVYGDCARHLGDVGVCVEEAVEEDEEGGSSEGGKRTRTATEKRDEEEKEDPVQAFLKKKRAEKDSHLMMLGS